MTFARFTCILVLVCAGCSRGARPSTSAPAPSPTGTDARAANAPAAAATTPLPEGVTDQMIASGRSLFNDGSCGKCHGPNGKNGRYGPDLTDDSWSQIRGTYPELVRVITAGVPASQQKLPTSSPDFAMRPRGGMSYDDDTIKRIAAYVWSLSHTKK